MKKITISFLMLCFSITTFAQVSIGKETAESESTILDFNNVDTNTNGLILSAVSELPKNLDASNNGTLLFDRTTKKVKMYENNNWVDLSDEGDDQTIETNPSEDLGKGVIIGKEKTNAKGILVLESENQAMILPRIADPHLTVKSPYPGMICYDTESKSLAVFDGKVWNYWK